MCGKPRVSPPPAALNSSELTGRSLAPVPDIAGSPGRAHFAVTLSSLRMVTQTPSFAELGVAESIDQRLQVRGIEEPFEIQRLVIPDAISGRDILGKAKTGSGKTLAFGIPLVQRLRKELTGTQALVLVPTRELCSQVTEDLVSIAPRRIKVLATYGGAGLGKHIEQAPTADVIVATPGRLIDLIDRKAAKLGGVHVLVIDEADRMADMG